MSYYSVFKIRQAVAQLKAGNIVAYPTEAVYGLGCDPLNGLAVMQLLNIKQRSVKKGLILIAASLEQLERFIILDHKARQRIIASLDEPITWLVPAQSWVPYWLTGEHQTLAVRVSKHPIATALCRYYGGPIVSTSANTSNKPAIRQARKLVPLFRKHRLFILAGRVGGLARETAIYDLATQQRLR